MYHFSVAVVGAEIPLPELLLERIERWTNTYIDVGPEYIFISLFLVFETRLTDVLGTGILLPHLPHQLQTKEGNVFYQQFLFIERMELYKTIPPKRMNS